MSNVVEFKQPERKYIVRVIADDGLVQTFEVESITRPKLDAEEHEVWYGDEVITILGPRTWGPITIIGSDEIGTAIRYSLQPPRVILESEPHAKNWWELHKVYLSTESQDTHHVLRFDSCNEHSYVRGEPKY